MRPVNGCPSAPGSTRHCVLLPSTTAGSPASPTNCSRAIPNARIRRSSRTRTASSIPTTGTPGGYTRSARSQVRCRPTRPAMATFPRPTSNSSMVVTLRLWVHPVDCQGTTAVSGMSRDCSGPASRSRANTSRWNAALACNHSRCFAKGCGAAIRARKRPRSAIGRIMATAGLTGSSCEMCSNIVRSCSNARFRSAGWYFGPRRLQAMRSAAGATAAVGSSCRNVSWPTRPDRSIGRSAPSS